MLYSEIKSLIGVYGVENIRTLYSYADNSAIRKLLAMPNGADVINAMFIATQDTSPYLNATAVVVSSMVDYIDTYTQIYNIVGSHEETAKLLYAITGSDEADYETDNWRIIHANYIDGILADEIGCDSYILGCFSADAIADATGWPYDLIRAAQKGEAFSEIGDAMTTDQIQKLAEIYAAADGYGHHFAHYDHYEHEIGTGSAGYYLFRIN